ncbi:hypothetical protein SapgrDRAFT_3532 [Saprospira grandis DSM 2844]|uniref:RHS repeat-associated core domain protein n=1 Tax=Saprospira grandis DSM 2844 TaxID=694433 RepID=J0PC14_9BACT|nr:hypothetical protein [Saprospira grandis]EJF55167.1 hypothetical protein SapgrDRAFT_3532 [Saprospira grandis DSM 2844]
MRKSPEIGSGHHTTYFRELDGRMGRCWSADPITFPHQSPYNTFDGNPIYYTDASGASVGYPEKEKEESYKATVSTEISSTSFARSYVQSVDKGDLIIFINGMHSKGQPCPDNCPDCGGREEYWGAKWTTEVLSQIGDYNAMFFDGSYGGFSGFPDNYYWSNREAKGYEMGLYYASDIILQLERNSQGQIIESVKFITNSMGAAYQRGFSQALVDYVATYNWDRTLVRDILINQARSLGLKGIDLDNYVMLRTADKKIEGFEIEFVVDIAAFGSNIFASNIATHPTDDVGGGLFGDNASPGQPSDPNAKTNYFMRADFDPVAGFQGSKINGVNAVEIHTPVTYGHHSSFFKRPCCINLTS